MSCVPVLNQARRTILPVDGVADSSPVVDPPPGELFTPFDLNDYSVGTIGESMGFFHSGVYDDNLPGTTERGVRIDLNMHNGVGCGGSHYFGGRIPFPEPVPKGATVWVSFDRYHPTTQTWGFCYSNANGQDAIDAAACGKSADAGGFLKDFVMSPSIGTARLYIQPRMTRRTIPLTAGIRIDTEAGGDTANLDAKYPEGEWFRYQVMVKVSDGADGLIRLWINDEFVAELDGPNISTASGNVFVNWGVGDYCNGVWWTDGGEGRGSFYQKNLIIASDMIENGTPTTTDSGGRIYIDPTLTVADFEV